MADVTTNEKDRRLHRMRFYQLFARQALADNKFLVEDKPHLEAILAADDEVIIDTALTALSQDTVANGAGKFIFSEALYETFEHICVLPESEEKEDVIRSLPKNDRQRFPRYDKRPGQGLQVKRVCRTAQSTEEKWVRPVSITRLFDVLYQAHQQSDHKKRIVTHRLVSATYDVTEDHCRALIATCADPRCSSVCSARLVRRKRDSAAAKQASSLSESSDEESDDTSDDDDSDDDSINTRHKKKQKTLEKAQRAYELAVPSFEHAQQHLRRTRKALKLAQRGRRVRKGNPDETPVLSASCATIVEEAWNGHMVERHVKCLTPDIFLQEQFRKEIIECCNSDSKVLALVGNSEAAKVYDVTGGNFNENQGKHMNLLTKNFWVWPEKPCRFFPSKNEEDHREIFCIDYESGPLNCLKVAKADADHRRYHRTIVQRLKTTDPKYDIEEPGENEADFEVVDLTNEE